MDSSSPAKRCPFLGEELISYLYGEALPAEKERVERHLATCLACRQERASMMATVRLLEEVGLAAVDDAVLAGEWPRLRSRLAAASRRAGAGGWSRQLLRAAGIALMAGASFWLGSSWRSSGGTFAGLWGTLTGGAAGRTDGATSPSAPGLTPEEESARLTRFARETNGYLNRSRLVLLAFSNAGQDETPEDLSRASASLLREAERASRLARDLKDPRLQELVTSLEGILGEIASLTAAGDDATIAQLRDSASLSSVLDQLELLAVSAARNTERPHA